MRALRSFWVEESPETKGVREVRLNAIRQLAEILQAGDNSAARDSWIEGWRKDTTAPSEALWALFHVGAKTATLDRVEAMAGANANDPKVAQAFIWLALQTRQFDRLGAWLKDKRRTPSERDFLFIALGQALDSDVVKADPALIDTLFAEGRIPRADFVKLDCEGYEPEILKVSGNGYPISQGRSKFIYLSNPAAPDVRVTGSQLVKSAMISPLFLRVSNGAQC